MTALRPKPFDRPQIRFITFPHHEKTAKAYSQQEIVGALFPPAAWACLSGAVSDPAQQRMTGDRHPPRQRYEPRRNTTVRPGDHLSTKRLSSRFRRFERLPFGERNVGVISIIEQAKILALSLLVARAVGVRRFKRDDFLRAIATTGLSNGTRPAPCYRVTVAQPRATVSRLPPGMRRRDLIGTYPKARIVRAIRRALPVVLAAPNDSSNATVLM